jgi:hypothetical protein
MESAFAKMAFYVYSEGKDSKIERGNSKLRQKTFKKMGR